jgi:hypothetical protein
MIGVSAPPRVRQQVLRAPDGPVPVRHRGRHAVYVELDGWCVGVVAARATAVPCALRVADPELPFAGLRAEVRHGVLVVDGQALVPGRLVGVAVPRIPVQLRGKAPGSGPDRCSSQQLNDSAHRPLTAADVAAVVGAGDGLTPYADDVLCGGLAVHRSARVATPEVDAAVRATLGRTTLLSATLLDCALRGEVVPEFAAWVGSLGTPAEPARAARLAAVGHTSGRGLLEGGRRALAELAPTVVAA